MVFVLLLLQGCLAINYSMRSQSNLGDWEQEYIEGSDQGFKEAADYLMTILLPYVPHTLLAVLFIYLAVGFFPKRAPKFSKKLPIQKRRI